MKLFCCGFNLYRQFIKCPTSIITSFVECTYDDITHFVPSLTYNLVCTNNNNVNIHSSEDNIHQIENLLLPKNFNISQSCCVDNRILLLSTEGTLIKYELKTKPFTPIHIATNITQVASGNKLTVALDIHGSLFNLPSQLEFSEQIIEIEAGCEHCLLLSNSGKVYSLGRGSRGQLGHGSLEDETEPKLIKALDGIRITKIAAGGWHSCALSYEGDLYTWGWNANGQLGIYENEKDAVAVMASPHVVDFDDNLELSVINVACGRRHTIALLSNQKLYGSGWNKYHQLAISYQNENVYKMKFLYDFSNRFVNDLKCGPWSSVVFLRD